MFYSEKINYNKLSPKQFCDDSLVFKGVSYRYHSIEWSDNDTLNDIRNKQACCCYYKALLDSISLASRMDESNMRGNLVIKDLNVDYQLARLISLTMVKLSEGDCKCYDVDKVVVEELEKIIEPQQSFEEKVLDILAFNCDDITEMRVNLKFSIQDSVYSDIQDFHSQMGGIYFEEPDMKYLIDHKIPFVYVTNDDICDIYCKTYKFPGFYCLCHRVVFNNKNCSEVKATTILLDPISDGNSFNPCGSDQVRYVDTLIANGIDVSINSAPTHGIVSEGYVSYGDTIVDLVSKTSYPMRLIQYNSRFDILCVKYGSIIRGGPPTKDDVDDQYGLRCMIARHSIKFLNEFEGRCYYKYIFVYKCTTVEDDNRFNKGDFCSLVHALVDGVPWFKDVLPRFNLDNVKLVPGSFFFNLDVMEIVGDKYEVVGKAANKKRIVLLPQKQKLKRNRNADRYKQSRREYVNKNKKLVDFSRCDVVVNVNEDGNITEQCVPKKARRKINKKRRNWKVKKDNSLSDNSKG